MDDGLNSWVDDQEKAVIFTTYLSFGTLMKAIKPGVVVFDECHRFNHIDLIEKDIHYLALSALEASP